MTQLLLSSLLAVGLIVAPLVATERRRFDRRHAPRFFVYFLGLGVGFIGIEIALMQKLTLFLGHPLYSITVTLFCILVFTGVGSLVSARWFETTRNREWFVPAGIALTVVLFVIAAPSIVRAAIGLPLAARVVVSAAILAPIAFLLGVPLAYGIRLLNWMNRSLIPWGLGGQRLLHGRGLPRPRGRHPVDERQLQRRPHRRGRRLRRLLRGSNPGMFPKLPVWRQLLGPDENA